MKIRQWLGYNEDASQYLLRPGELRVLNNLQPRRPGMLIARKGLAKIYGQYEDEAIYGLYRRATTLGNPSDFLWLQKVLVPRTLTIQQLEDREELFEYVWWVRRVEGYQSRVIDTQPLSPNGLTTIPNFCVAEDRHGRMFLFYGHGARPKMYRPTDLANVAVDMGLDAPKIAPSVLASGDGYFIESIDVKSGGGSYYAPPDLTITGGSPTREARLKAVVQAGNVVSVDILDGGAGYKTPPEIKAAFDKVGTGFRARGNINTSARTIEGFSETDAAVVTGTAATNTQTYGSTNGTTGNTILYLTRPRVVSEKVLSSPTVSGTYSQTGTTVTVTTTTAHRLVTGQSVTLDFTSGTAVDGTFTVTVASSTQFTVQRTTATTSGNVTVGVTALTLNSVAGIAVGDVVTVYPAATPFSNSTVTVTAINATASTVTLSSSSFAPVSGTAYEATFSRPSQISQAKADYDSSRKRFVATIPISSASTTGSNAHATLEFSPLPLGYGLNAASTSSIQVVNQNWQTYKSGNTYTPYLNDEYWEGSLMDQAKSAENSRYGGLQASGAQFVRGFSGSVNGRRGDVYFPDYSKISVWFCTGTYSSNINQWTRADVTVTEEGGASVLRFRLRPTKNAKTIKSLGGAAISTQYSNYDELPEAEAPEVRLQLRECPDSWIAESDQCVPTSAKEAKTNRLPWWVDGTNVTRPIVDIKPEGQALNASVVSITDAGGGWQKGTVFAFRIYQANAYAQYNDFNTAVVEEAVPRGHAFYEANNRYVEFKFTADTPDPSAQHGPPQTLITPVQVTIPGEGYLSGQTGTITLYRRGVDDSVSQAIAAQTLTWTAKVLDTLSATSPGNISSITILSKGQNYFAPPTIEVRGGGNGYGLSVLPSVVDGRIDSVRIVDAGMGYTTAPELFTGARAAEVTPVMRPTMRGKYRCAYRFVDRTETVVKTATATLGDSATTLTLSSTEGVEPGMILDASLLPHNAMIKSVNGDQVEINQQITALAANTPISVMIRDMTKPISYSDLSPIVDVDAGPNEERTHSSLLTWSVPGVTPPPRADKVEFWRTSADQSLVFYRTDVYGIPTPNGIQVVGTDSLTDEELFDVDRAHYAAMPVVLPNGGLNAYRFGKPRDDMSVAVAFQDRLWMGVSTSGKDVNTLYFSEFDEFESTPDTNELPIQNNQKSTDVLTALVPFGSMLLAMQHSHTYAVAYNSDPAVDASIQMMSHRGCLHQRAWDIHENVLYAVDESGIYAMSRNGEVQDISLPIRDFFVSELIDFTKRETFFLQADPKTHILRFFCTLKSQATDTPAYCLCFDIQAKTWWTESFPNSITSACTGRPSAARINTILLGAVDGNLYEISGDSDHANDTITDIFITEGGSGYREAPAITVPNCNAAVVQGVVSEGRLVDVVIQSSGWGARGGLLLATEDGRTLATTSLLPADPLDLSGNREPTDEDGRELGGVEYLAIKLNIGPPEPGGVQAVAHANFSVTPRVVRECTVSEGESFVRLDPARTAQLQPQSTPAIATLGGAVLLTEEFRKTVSITRGLSSRTLILSPADIAGAGVGMTLECPLLPPNSVITGVSGTTISIDKTITALAEGQSATAEVVDILRPIVSEPPPVEIGMEAIGDFLPLNAFVSRIDGNDIHLEHPDGTPAKVVYGDARTNQGGTQMTVTFRKPYRVHIPFRMATGYMQLINEDNAKGGDALVDRSVTLVYTPTASDKTVELLERFNGQQELRPNIARRSREGAGGFVHRQDSASTALNTNRTASRLGYATGVATARFASRAITDLGGEDQHIQVELYARPEQASPWQRTNYWIPNPSILEAQPFVMHSLSVNGVVDDGE